ncbi:DUF1559 domain-containing protein [Aquisphaera insulae]|uniref:DUF1559 domain-containing protein n=1 Tax=Aquisphaera insulae TaxID=2712864 RepID=UPI0013EAD6A8|nr:DUF1559 domain-containing protein [Aquisphaera insulae]
MRWLSGRRRAAFTLIELLVVIAVIAVLIGLLMPAVQSARSAARRAQCQNNLKQLGVALASYMSGHNVFPMSAVAGTGRGINQSCFALILPELEQRPLYAAYNFSLENFDPSNRSVVGTQISTFLCPESPLEQSPLAAENVVRFDGTKYPAGSAFGRCNYAANWGGSQNTLGKDFTQVNGSYRGVMVTVKATGPKGPTTCFRSQDIRDGMSNTISVGEKRDSQGWDVGGYAGSEFDVATSPDLLQSAAPEQKNDPLLQKVFSGSFHAGQTHFLFCDGSVRPLRTSVNKATWYALVTRDGKEVVNGDSY